MSQNVARGPALPFRFRFEPGKVTIEAWDRVDPASALQAARELAHHPKHNRGFDVLADLRRIAWDAGAAETADFAQALAQFSDRFRGRVAVVVEPELFDLAAVTSELASLHGFYMRPFADLQEAERWLDEPDWLRRD